MISIFNKVKLLFIGLFSVLQLNGQVADEVINGLRLSSTSKVIQLDWEIVGGNTCFGITIERSEDEITFNKVGFIEGICGGLTNEVYSFTDSIPLINRKNCYRLILGAEGTTSPSCIEFTAFNNGYYLQKGQEQLKFLFEKQYQSSQIRFYSLDGRLIYSDLLSGNELLLDINLFSSGIYFFTLERLQHTKFSIP